MADISGILFCHHAVVKMPGAGEQMVSKIATSGYFSGYGFLDVVLFEDDRS